MWSFINISSLNENCSLLLNLLLLNHFVNIGIYSRTFISNKISKIGIHVIRKINERLGSYPKDSPFLIEICFVPSPWTNLWPQAIRSRLTTIASFRVSWLGLESNENFFLKKYRWTSLPRFIVAQDLLYTGETFSPFLLFIDAIFFVLPKTLNVSFPQPFMSWHEPAKGGIVNFITYLPLFLYARTRPFKIIDIFLSLNDLSRVNEQRLCSRL